MRISDWSSDVCSSDLPALKSARISSVESSLLDRASSIFAILFMFIPRVHTAQDGAFHCSDFQNRQKIGRASGWERVCSQLLMSVGVVFFKQNIESYMYRRLTGITKHKINNLHH